MPNKLDILALKIAAGIFPLAIDTITTEEETVEGSAARKKNPSQIVYACSLTKSGLKRSINKGKRRNVAHCMSKCIFQLDNPDFNFAGFNFNP